MSATLAAFASASFPGEDALCEKCGYRLCGLQTHRDCPECGTPIAQSHPRHREGLPWQRAANPRHWCATARMIVTKPGAAFERLRIDQRGRDADGNSCATSTAGLSNMRDRLFLLSFALPLGLVCAAIWFLLGLPRPWAWTVAAPAGILTLSYIEATGVTFISRRRGWRVPFRLAERVVCYASVAWQPAAIICCLLLALHLGPIEWQRRYTFGLFHGDERDYPWLVLVGAASILWFESLVWLGIRRVRYANATHGGESWHGNRKVDS